MKNLHWNRVLLLGLGAVTLLACNKQGDQHPPGQTQANAPTPAGNVPPLAQKQAAEPNTVQSVDHLDDDLRVQPPRTTSDARLPPPWQEVTPTTAQAGQGTAQAGQGTKLPAPKPGAAAQTPPDRGPVRTWMQPAVLIGRKSVWLADKAIAPVACTAKDPQQCQDEAASDRSSARYHFQPEQIENGKLKALTEAAAGLKDKDIVVLADRRVTWQTVDVTMETLRAVGARPILAAGGFDGELVNVMGAGTALPEAATLTAARRAAEPKESSPGSLPQDATTLTIEVTPQGVAVEIGRATGEPVRPEIMGNVVESLIALVSRMLLAAPAVQHVTLKVDADVAVEEVIRVIDGVRDDCGRTGHGQRCPHRLQLFARIEILLNPPSPEPLQIGVDGSLRLDAKAPVPGSLHLGDGNGGLGLRLQK